MMGFTYMDCIANSSDLSGSPVESHASQMQQAVGALAIIVDACLASTITRWLRSKLLGMQAARFHMSS